LRALHSEQVQNPGTISSIDVLIRPGKRVGRNLKKVREVPIKAVAQELGLPIHERDTFTGWNLPKRDESPINLIIAVSFGLFVPPRILRSVEYGGLNVHPSLLPDFRGPAPLHHTILQGRTHTGVTLQTLDQKSFDHGIILAQTPHPGLEIPNSDRVTYSKLLEFITPKAADLLVQGIRNQVFMPPVQEVKSGKAVEDQELIHATKISPKERQINAKNGISVDIEKRYRALGRLWGNVLTPNGAKRFTFEDFEIVSLQERAQGLTTQTSSDVSAENIHGRLVDRNWTASFVGEDSEELWTGMDDGKGIIIKTVEGKGLRVKEITVEGQSRKPAGEAMRKALHQPNEIH